MPLTVVPRNNISFPVILTAYTVRGGIVKSNGDLFLAQYLMSNMVQADLNFCITYSIT